MRAAIDAGTAFEIEKVDGRSGGFFPAAETIFETVSFALARGFIERDEEIVIRRHLPGSKIGAALVEEVWRGKAAAAVLGYDPTGHPV